MVCASFVEAKKAAASHAQLPVDSDWIENQIRPIAIGPNNWLFAGSARATNVMSLIQSARMNEKDPIGRPESRRGMNGCSTWWRCSPTVQPNSSTPTTLEITGTIETRSSWPWSSTKRTVACFASTEHAPVPLKMWARATGLQGLPAGHRRLRSSGAVGDVGPERQAVRPC